MPKDEKDKKMKLIKAEIQFAKAAYQNGYVEGYDRGLTADKVSLNQKDLEKAWEYSNAKRIYEK